jgi:tetratricopeptide (TPR) repeat protein
MRRRPIARAAAAVALLLVLAARMAAAQEAGTLNLLAAPGAWPTTGAVSTSTALALDPSAVYLNPAGLAMQDERSLLVHHGLLQFDTSWDLAAVAYPLPGLGAVGIGLARVGTSGIEAFDANNQPLGSIGYSETALAASVSRKVYGPVTAGLTFKVLSQSLGEASAAASAVDLGALYRPAVLRGGQIGLAVQNAFGGSLDLGGSAPSLGRSLRVGLASPEWRWGGRNALRGILDLGKQGPEPMTSRAGVEMTRAGWGSLRAGLNAGHPVLGAGVTWRRYGIDVAIAQGEVETMHQIALHVAWGEPLSQYEERRRAQYQKAAEESLLARSAARHALDRAKAEASETSGDWEVALVLWEVIARERPEDAAVARRAAKARDEVSAKARRAVDEETARRLASTLAALTRDALGRGDLEEAEGLRRGLDLHAGAAGTAYADSLTQLATALDVARAREASRSAARADSLHRQGRVLESAEAAALALRLDPNQAQARDVWSALQGSVGKSANDAAALARKLDALTAVHAASQAFNEGRYSDAQTAVRKALALDPGSKEAKAWKERVQRRLATPRPELDARIKQLYIRGMEAFSSGDYKEALRNWEQILVLDPLNESARRNVLEARERMKAEASR